MSHRERRVFQTKIERHYRTRKSLLCTVLALLLLPLLRAEEAQTITAKPTFEAAPLISADRIDMGPTPMEALPDWHIENFAIPAPRSLIVSSDGQLLARNRIARRLVCRLATIAKTEDEVVARFTEISAQISPDLPYLKISEEDLLRHYQNRAWVPIPVTAPIPDSIADAIEHSLPDGCSLAPLYVREYPQKDLTAHIIGYIGVTLPDQHGPIGMLEYDFPPTEGRAGMEKSLDDSLKGREGEVLRLVDQNGVLRHQDIVRPAKPGDTAVLTIHLEMQRLAKQMLERSGRPGAFVAVDADTGDILAMMSTPSFDPNLFEGGISQADYDALSGSDAAPLFDRAVNGAYPPGSTFKPFVALAGMEAGEIVGTYTLLPSPTGMMIGGRYFKNHSSRDEGLMDVRYALIRSCNTWFYQAGLNTGAQPIAEMARRFGFGVAPDLPVPSVAPGNIPNPDTYGDPRSLANFSIGQGQVLVSPVQLAFAMAGLANGRFVPKARLLRETADPVTGEVARYIKPAVSHPLDIPMEDVDIIRDGMWGVVNHGAGTAGSASLRNPVVYGKTGTSQWATGGKLRSLAWFAGWVDAERPRIAFAVMTQGSRGETLSGGRSAAPIAAGVLRTVYQDPTTYAVTVPDGPSRQVSAIAVAIPPQEEMVIEVAPEQPGVGGFFRRLFGGGRREGRGTPPGTTFP